MVRFRASPSMTVAQLRQSNLGFCRSCPSLRRLNATRCLFHIDAESEVQAKWRYVECHAHDLRHSLAAEDTRLKLSKRSLRGTAWCSFAWRKTAPAADTSMAWSWMPRNESNHPEEGEHVLGARSAISSAPSTSGRPEGLLTHVRRQLKPEAQIQIKKVKKLLAPQLETR